MLITFVHQEIFEKSMRSTVYLYVSSIHIVNFISPVFGDNIFKCEENAARSVLSCTSEVPGDVVLPVEKFSHDVESISITTRNGAIWKITHVNTFTRFPKLVSLNLDLEGSWELSKNLNNESTKREMRMSFFSKTNLENLSITYLNKNTQRYLWYLPITLKSFTLFNSVFGYITSTCHMIKSLNLTKTDVQNIPDLGTGCMYTLETLDLSYSSLETFKPEDIITYCFLTYISIKGSNMSCEQMMWFDSFRRDYEKKGTYVFVSDPLNDTCNKQLRMNIDYKMALLWEKRITCFESLPKPNNWRQLIKWIIITFVIGISIFTFCIFWSPEPTPKKPTRKRKNQV